VVVGVTTENDVRVLVSLRADRVAVCREVELKLVKEEANVKGANVLESTEVEELESTEEESGVTKLNEALEVAVEELLAEEESVAVELDPEEESPLLVDDEDSPDEVSSPEDEDPELELALEELPLEVLVGPEEEEGVVGSGLVTGVLDPPSAKPITPCAKYPASAA